MRPRPAATAVVPVPVWGSVWVLPEDRAYFDETRSAPREGAVVHRLRWHEGRLSEVPVIDEAGLLKHLEM